MRRTQLIARTALYKTSGHAYMGEAFSPTSMATYAVRKWLTWTGRGEKWPTLRRNMQRLDDTHDAG